MGVAYSQTIAAATNYGTSLTITGITLSGPDLALAAICGGGGTISGVTYAGASMTSPSGATSGSDVVKGFYKLAPSTSSSQSLVLTKAASNTNVLGGVLLTGAHQSNAPTGFNANGTSAALSYNATTVSGNVVVSAAFGSNIFSNPGYDTSTYSVTVDPSAGQTQRTNIDDIALTFGPDSGSGLAFSIATETATGTSTSSGFTVSATNDGTGVSDTWGINSIALVFGDAAGGGSPVQATASGESSGGSSVSYQRISQATVSGESSGSAAGTAVKIAAATVICLATVFGASTGGPLTQVLSSAYGETSPSGSVSSSKLAAATVAGEAGPSGQANYARESLASVQSGLSPSGSTTASKIGASAVSGGSALGASVTSERVSTATVSGDAGVSASVTAITAGVRAHEVAGEASGGGAAEYAVIRAAAASGSASASGSTAASKIGSATVSGEASGASNVQSENPGTLPVESSAYGMLGAQASAEHLKLAGGSVSGGLQATVENTAHKIGAAGSIGASGSQATVVGVKDPTAVYADMYRTVELGDTVERSIIVTDSILVEVWV